MDAETSVASSFQYELAIERQIGMMAKAGFSHFSLAARHEHSGYLESGRRSELKARLRDLGVGVDTIHARPLHEPDAVERASATARAAADLRAPCVVAHVGPFHCH